MSIQTTIALNNQMTPVLESINRSLNYTISAMENMRETSQGMFDVSTLNRAKESLSNATIDLQNIESQTNDATLAQINYNDEVKKTHNLLGGLPGKIAAIVGAYAGIRSIKWFQETSDEMANIKARLNAINDGSQTLEELQEMIYNSAQRSRGEYLMTADIISKLGTQAKATFSSNRETIAFAENLNKLFTIAGTSAQGVESVMYNLTQALGSGVLRGQDLNAVMSNTNQIIEIVAKYMDTDIGQIRKLAAEGKLSASVIKNAILDATENIDGQGRDIPMTCDQIMIQMKNVFIKEMQPALEYFNMALNSSNFQMFVSNGARFLGMLARAIAVVSKITIDGFNLIYNAIDVIKVPLFTVLGLMALYNGILTASSAFESIKAGVSFLHARAMSMIAIATGNATAIQGAYNSMLWASPLFIIPAVIILIISLIFGIISAINHVKGTSISAIGIITGAISAGISITSNIFIGFNNFMLKIIETLVNGYLSFAQFFADVFVNPIAAVKNLFYDLGIFVLGILSGIAKGIDAVFGSNLSAAVDGWIGTLNSKKTVIENRSVEYKKVDFDNLMAKRKSISDAYKSGYDFGKNKEAEIKNFINEKFSTDFDWKNGFDTGKLDELIDGVGGIENNTKDIKNEIGWDNNNLAGLKDLMLQRAITDISKETKIEVYNQYTGNISSDIDIEQLKKEVSDDMVYNLDVALNGGV